jgi:hypothetical protein
VGVPPLRGSREPSEDLALLVALDEPLSFIQAVAQAARAMSRRPVSVRAAEWDLVLKHAEAAERELAFLQRPKS